MDREFEGKLQAVEEESQERGLSVQERLKDFTPEEQQKIEELAGMIPVGDTRGVMEYGVGAQSHLSGFSESMLGQVKQKEIGEVGEVLGSLMEQLHGVDIKDFEENKGIVARLFGKAKRKADRALQKYQSVSANVNQITVQLEDAKTRLMSDISIMDNMYENNKEYLKGIELYIVAGELKMEQVKSEVLPVLQEKALSSEDSLVHQELQDTVQYLERLDKRIYDLKLSKQIIVQSAPQIRMIQSTSQVLAEKIQSSILTSIPLWKNQITIALTLQTQGKAVEAQKMVTDTTNDLLLKNSEMLKMNTINVAKENERGIIEIDTLKKSQENLISTIEETMKIQSEGRKQRQLAEEEIGKMEKELKERLVQIHGEYGEGGRTSYAGTRETVDQKVNYLEM